jgi:hypothetical protein
MGWDEKNSRGNGQTSYFRSTETSAKTPFHPLSFTQKQNKKCSDIGNSKKSRKFLLPYTEYFCYVLRTEVHPFSLEKTSHARSLIKKFLKP